MLKNDSMYDREKHRIYISKQSWQTFCYSEGNVLTYDSIMESQALTLHCNKQDKAK